MWWLSIIFSVTGLVTNTPQLFIVAGVLVAASAAQGIVKIRGQR